MTSPDQKHDDELSKLLAGSGPSTSDQESSQEVGTLVICETSAGEPTGQMLEAADCGEPVDEKSSTSNNPTGLESSLVPYLPPGFGLLAPCDSSNRESRSSRRKSKPKKLVVPEEEEGRSPLDGVDSTADELQDSVLNDCPAPSKPRRPRKSKPTDNFRKPHLTWRSGDSASLMFVVPSEEMETIENKKRKKREKEVELQEMYWCEICDECFASVGDLEMHQSTHIEEAEENFDCEECGRVFDTASELEEHQSKKHGKMRYCCDICGIQYNYQSQFRIHMRAHSGERQFTCNECGKEFKHRCSLVIHQRRHVGETPHPCQKCNKMLDTRSALVKHEKMRYCPDCNKCYTHRSFNKHLIKNCIKP